MDGEEKAVVIAVGIILFVVWSLVLAHMIIGCVCHG